jgi:hypothetical protein
LAAEAAVTAERCAAQLLCGPAAGRVEEVAARLLAIQAQDPRGARLTFRSRSAGLSAADVDDALARRSVVVSWLNRGTLHLVLAEDYWWLHPLTAPQVSAGNARRLAQEGVPPDDAERGVAAVTAALTADGPLTRSQLRERVAAAGVRTEGQALVHVLLLASIRGLIVRGPVAGREQAFVLTRDWLGAPPPLDRETALGELARRYLAGHAPANDRDLAKWAGIGLREARAGLARAGAAERPDGLAELPGQRRAAGAALPPPRLLGAFDPLLLGWASRDPVVGPHRQIVTVNGLFRPFALVAGRAVATWGLAGGQVTLAPFGPLDAATRVALEAEAADVTRFLGLLPGSRHPPAWSRVKTARTAMMLSIAAMPMKFQVRPYSDRLTGISPSSSTASSATDTFATNDTGRVRPRTVRVPETCTPSPAGLAPSAAKVKFGWLSTSKKSAERRCLSRRALPVSSDPAPTVTAPVTAPAALTVP